MLHVRRSQVRAGYGPDGCRIAPLNAGLLSSAWRRMRCCLALALVFGLAVRPATVAAQADPDGLSAAALDSVRSALESPDWNERHAALVRVNRAYPAALPSAILPPIVDLLAREASDTVSHEEDEDFGEYLVDVVLTAVRTGDPRVVPGILAVDGLSMSSGIAGFVASQGRAVMPALDGLAATRSDRASDVAETYALMYARYGTHLDRADSVRVLQRLLLAATHTSPAVRAHLTYVAGKGQIAELLPLVADLAVSDTGVIMGQYVVRDDATEALPALQRARAAMPTAELFNRLILLTAAVCGPADVRAAVGCSALTVNLTNASRLLAAGQSRLVAKELDAYARTAVRLGADGFVPRLSVVTLDGTARALIVRLVA